MNFVSNFLEVCGPLMWYLRAFLQLRSKKGPQNTYRTISTLSDNKTRGRWIIFEVIQITIPCVYCLEVFGQLLWCLHVFLLFEAKMATKTYVWLDLSIPNTKIPL